MTLHSPSLAWLGLLVLAAVSCASPGPLAPAQTSVFASGLGDPAGIATTPSGLVLVADAGKGHVVVLDGKGRRLRTFGSGILESPLGLAVDADGSVLVSDSMKDKVFRFSKDGKLILSFGQTGRGDGEFSGAGPLAIRRNGDIYVTDIDNNRIQVFDRDGRFKFTFGKEGQFRNSAPGEIYFPGGLAMDKNDRVYLADTHNFRVQVFSPKGRFETMWGRQGTWIGEFDHPFGIAVDDRSGRVYVVDDHIKLQDGGRRVQVFTDRGRFLGLLRPRADEPPLHHAFDVAVAPDGRLLVSERAVGRVRVLSPTDMQEMSTATRAASRPGPRPTSRPTSGSRSDSRPSSRPTTRPEKRED